MAERIEVVSDWATQRGGGERVAIAMVRALGGPPLTLGLYNPDATFPELADMDVRTLPINRVAAFRRNQRLALPVLAPAFSRLRVDADLTVIGSCGFAHGARTTGRKVVYCHTPARWLYQTDRYVREFGWQARAALSVLAPPLRRWDRRMAATADDYLCNSTAVRDRIRDLYDRDATVLPPPHTIDVTGPTQPVEGVEPGFLLCISRLLPYKNVDAVIEAVSALRDERLVVVGAGPDRERLAAIAGDNVTMLQDLSDAEVRWLYRAASGMVAASYEDYGIIAVEAAAFGVPIAALRWGGFLDTVVPGTTGCTFEEPTAAAIRSAIAELRSTSWSPDAIAAHAERFSEDRFAADLRRVLGVAGAAPPGTTLSSSSGG